MAGTTAGGAGEAVAGAAGEPTTSTAGSESGGGGAGGEGREPPRTDCPTGTADCDDNHDACATDPATDPQNCGRCERACGATAACSAGLCNATVILDPNVASNWCGGAFSASKAYMITCWGNNDLSEIRTASLEPGADITGQRIRHYTNVSVVAMRGILIDGGDVYYGLEASPSNLWKFPLDANDTEDVSVGVTLENGLRFDALQLVGDTYYWSDNTHTAAGQVTGATLYKRKKTDTASTPLVTGLGLAYDLQVSATKLVFLEVRTQGANCHVYRAPLAGATAAELDDVAVATSGSYLVQSGEYAYWTIKNAKPNGKLQRLRYADDAAEAEDFVTGLDVPEGLAADDDFLYFKQKDALYRVAKSGGAPEQLSPAVPANDSQATQIFHVDDRYVYFAAGATAGASTLVRVAK